MTQVVFIDQNGWVALARGAWDKDDFPKEHEALRKIVEAIQSGSIIAPLTFANIYETAKINDPIRRANIARTQASVSAGIVFRGRRRIFAETLAAYIARRYSIPRPAPAKHWFLSDLWFEAASDYSPEVYGFDISERALDFIRHDPPRALFDYLLFSDEEVRLESVRQFSADSSELITRMEARRAIVAGESLAMRKRVYGARLIIDELDFILATGKNLGLTWLTVRDLGSSVVRGIAAEVPILNVERELVVRLEDQRRDVNENDLRDMASFTVALPLADIVIAEKQFVNLARQSGFDRTLGTNLMTSIFDFGPS